MKKDKLQFSTWIILLILFVSFASIVYQILLKNVVVDILNIKAPWITETISSIDLDELQSIGIDWKAKYPFPEEAAYEQIEISVSKDNVEEGKINRIFSQFESYATEWYMGASQSKVVSKLFNKSLGMNLVQDPYNRLVFQLQDGRYMAERPYKSSADEAANVISFNNWLGESGIEFLYVTLPSPVDPEEETSIIERGYQEYSNLMADELGASLLQEDVHYLDLRQSMKQQNISWTDSFYGSDHHWKPSCGLWAAEQIAKEISTITGGQVNDVIFDKDSYAIQTYDGVYYGGFAKSLSSVYCDPDDMEIWEPKFATNFEKEVPDYNVYLNGSFKDVMFNMTEWPSYNI